MNERPRSGQTAHIASGASKLVIEHSPDGKRVCVRKGGATIFMSVEEWNGLIAAARKEFAKPT
jgi:hypothetical protein